ncbi:MAG: DUF4129 domain-containing protein [Chloroflexi bacterium]|nr:DUF4129 domain-containing protein [Chloroflexota bacterium]
MRFTEIERMWNWLDDGVLPYALAAMRAIWIWLLLQVWANWMQPPRAGLIAPLNVFTLLALSTLFAQIAAFKLRDARGTWLVAWGGIIAVALALYGAFGLAVFENLGAFVGVLLAAAWCWRWGILAGREPLTYDTFGRNFMYGVVALALSAFIVFTTHVLAPGELILPILLFFAFGLGALALASLRDTQRYERAKVGAAFALNRYWLVTVGVVIAGMLFIGLLLGGTFAPEWAQRAIAALLLVWQFVTGILLVLAFAIAFVFFGALDLLGRVIHFTPSETKPPQVQVPRLDELFQNQSTPPPQVAPELYLLAQIAAAILIALLLAALFALALRRFHNYGEEDVTETRDSVFSMGLLQAQLRKLFQRNAAKPSAVAPYAEIRGDDARVQIRKLYQEFLAWAETRGVERRAGQTPREFQQALETHLRVAHEPLTLLTTAYVNARYSMSPITATEVAQVKDAWQTLVQSNGVRDV